MDLLWVKTNKLIKTIFPKYIWDIPNHENKVYLTFDDGPTPEITKWVLEILKEHNIKATFFCIGNNIEKHPELFLKVIEDGHSIGNHTYNHLKGWKTRTGEYVENTERCEKAIRSYSENRNQESKIFRPPYGKIKFSQSKALRKLGYKIIMWDIISVDYDKNITPEKCLENVIKNTVSGSIIVFHDSVKAFENLKFALPKAIHYLKSKGFIFEKID